MKSHPNSTTPSRSRSRLRRLFLAIGLVALTSLGGGAASATAAPVWNLELHHNETNFAPGATGEYWFEIANVGSTNSVGPTTLTVNLPAGLTRASVRGNRNFFGQVSWTCPGSPGDVVVTCTTTGSIPRHTLSTFLVLAVNVSPLASGTPVTTASVQGGGAAAPAGDSEPTPISPTPAPFGIVPESFEAGFFKADGLTPIREAGAHPELFTVAFDLNSVANPTGTVPQHKSPAGSLRNLQVELPPGFVGYPAAVGECEPAELTVAACPPSSQVGRIDATTEPNSVVPGTTYNSFSTGVFNMTHPRGVITDLAFVIGGNPIHVKVSLDPERNYAIKSTVSDINESLPVFFQKLTLWGVPAHQRHDSERCGSPFNTSSECAAEIPVRPFLSLPSQCGVTHKVKLERYDSWQNPGVFGPDLERELPGPISDCEKTEFEPEVSVEPTGHQANTPTGLDVHIEVPQNEEPDELATPPVKSVKVTLPEGMTVSPSFADGLTACSQGQIGLGSDSPVGCPDSSRIGAVTLSTPVLPGAVEGSMYMAAQRSNPFGSTFAVYLVLRDTEERGILVKIPGKLELNPATGRITTSFDDLPQFPFEDLTLTFRGGPRAPLVSPPTCGPQRIGIEMSSYARPGEPLDLSHTYQVTQGANGTPCPANLTARPFAPRMDAGTLTPRAGAFSPFVFRLTREDQDQELSAISTMLPLGLTAKIAGIPFCPDGAIASISAAEGSGLAEQATPSCPRASRIGTINTGVGAGSSPNFFAGSIYLAGPYKGAPLSMAIVVPALAGPFDLGNVVVRAAVQVDPQTAQIRVVSDRLPTILHGVLLRLRDIRLKADRPETMLNPTSCDPMSVDALLTGVGGSFGSAVDDVQMAVRNRFQVGGCRALGFKPRLSFRLRGGIGRGGYPSLKATVRARPGDANIARAVAALPASTFLAQEHIRTVCTRVQFAADACPAGSVYGRAKAVTPLLDEPLEGPVYLRSSSNALPDLVAKLEGKLEIHVVGRIDSIKRRIRTTFAVVPDAPITRFTLNMRGGRKGLLVNSRNLCRQPARARVRMVGHNGKASVTRPKMRSSCKKKLGKGKGGKPDGR